jgi:2-polyprenyl-3-methyl-5-hydroxy-6-metoxy-1,4-benzoquinol methylase
MDKTTSPHGAVPERIDPEAEPIGVVSYHLAKYAFARDLIGADRVLDVACGVGYGSAFLADVAQRVVGIELASEAFEVARVRYASERCSFVQGDAERLPFDSKSFDVVVCFEGIEHFQHPDVHVAEVARVLRHEGCFLISTPHPDAHTHGSDNPYHLHEFDVATFRSMLEARFGRVELWGQRRRRTQAHSLAQRADVLGLRRIAWLRPVTRLVSRSVLRTAATDEATLDDFIIEPWSDDATEYIAICREPRP